MKIHNKKLDVVFRLLIVLVANFLLSIATVWFLEPAHLYSGGATGLAQLIQRFIQYLGGDFNLGALVLIVNIPIVLIGFKYVSLKFALYSLVAVLTQSLFTGFMTSSPFEALAERINVVNELGVTETAINYGGVLTLAIFGGLLSGFAAGLALKFGTSTGGIDVLSQALALHKNFSIGTITMAFNVLIAVIGGGILQGSWVVFLFTCVRMILNSLVMDKLHTSYTYTSLHIFSHEAQNIGEAITVRLKRGCSLLNVIGVYSHSMSQELYCVVSTYEIEQVIEIVNEFDQKAFVTMSPVKKIKGNFIKKTIV